MNTYILSTKTTNKTESEHSFNCPVCRQITDSGSCSENQDVNTDQFSVNHFVISLLDSVAFKKSEKKFDPCYIKGATSRAISWCSICEKAFCESCDLCHKMFKMLSTHRLVSLSDTSTEMRSAKSQLLCEKHSFEIIKFYCFDHSEALCSACATLLHRECGEVISIEVAASGIKQSEKSSEYL